MYSTHILVSNTSTAILTSPSSIQILVGLNCSATPWGCSWSHLTQMTKEAVHNLRGPHDSDSLEITVEAAPQASVMSCYRKTNGQVEAFGTNLTPCGASSSGTAEACCSAGDICLSNSICHYNEPSDGGSGYYLAGCTDPNFKDPACMQACVDLPFQDIVFNFTSNLWECCGNQHACAAPVSTETFQELPPSQLQILSTAAPNAAAAAVISATPTPNSNPSLTTSAAIGISIICTIFLLTIVALSAWRITVRMRRRKQPPPKPAHDFNSFGGYEIRRGPSTISADSKEAFLASYPQVYHVDGGVKRELEG